MKQLHRIQGLFVGLVMVSLHNMMKASLGVQSLLPGFDDVLDQVSGPWSMPEARICNSTSQLFVLVMSMQNRFDQRRAIRETWAKGNPNVYFVIGQPCPYSHEQRLNDGSCTIGSNNTYYSTNYRYAYHLRLEHNRLMKEQDQHRDILFATAKEDDRSLPSKLKRGYEFVVETCPATVNWILKAEDDFYVRVQSLTSFIEKETLNSNLDPTTPTVVGKFVWWNDPVSRDGKNAELEYKNSEYPIYVTGSYGHVVSRPIAEFVTKNQHSLHEYQREDTSLGIWLKEQSTLAEPVKWILAADQQSVTDSRLVAKLNETGPFSFPYARVKSRFDGSRDCMDQKFYVIGHGITPSMIRRCYTDDDDVKRFRKVYNKTNLSVMVVSHRSNFARRKAIRETWAAGQTNVRFVIGKECPIPRDQRLWLRCELKCSVKKATWALWEMWNPCQQQSNATHVMLLANEAEQLKKEQDTHNDIVFASTVESYRGIVPKVKEAYTWAVTNTKSDWILKADDDMYVRVDLLSKFLSRFSSSKPTVVGKVIHNAPVWRDGKWIETDYKPDYYPRWAQGAAGHVVSRSVAEYIHKNEATLHNYQGEDVSIGIWLDESPMKDEVDWQNSRLLQMENGCTDSPAVVIGHDMSPARQRECHEELKDVDYIDFDAEESRDLYGSMDSPESMIDFYSEDAR